MSKASEAAAIQEQAENVIGMTTAKAMAYLNSVKLSARIKRENAVVYQISTEIVPTRVNLYTDNGKVTSIDIG